jgi:hypothetical protein
MTPRQISGALWFAERRRRRRAAEQLGLQALASRAEANVLKRKIESAT